MAAVAGPQGGMMNLLVGLPVSTTGAGTAATSVGYLLKSVGPLATVPGGTTSNVSNIGLSSPKGSETVANMTLACICRPSSFTNGNSVVNSGADQTAPAFRWSMGGTGSLGIVVAGSSIGSSLQMVLGHDYFIAYSWGAHVQGHEYAVDMTTGAWMAASFNQGGLSQVTGADYGVLSYNVATACGGIGVAAAFAAVTALSLPQLIAWGQDPWALWYG